MKQGWKVFWIITGTVAGIGAVFCILAFALGLSFGQIRDPRVQERGVFNRIFGHILDFSEETSEGHDWDESFAGVANLTIRTTGCRIELEESDGQEVCLDTGKVELPSGVELAAEQEEDTLTISTKRNRTEWWEETSGVEDWGTIYVKLPKEQRLETVDIGCGASEIRAEKIAADRVNLLLEGGNCEIDEMEAANLQAEIGAGKLEVNGEVKEDLSISCGAGKVELELEGNKKDYNYILRCGAGEIKIDRESYSGLAYSRQIDNGSANIAVINCGVGKVEVNLD